MPGTHKKQSREEENRRKTVVDSLRDLNTLDRDNYPHKVSSSSRAFQETAARPGTVGRIRPVGFPRTQDVFARLRRR